MKKLLLLILIGIFLVSFVSATQQTLGVFKQGECIPLIQTHGNTTYNNISFVLKTGESPVLFNVSDMMTKVGTFYNYTFCNTSELGKYLVNGFGNPDGKKTSWVYDFTITPSGKESSTSESILYAVFVTILFGLLIGLFYFIFVLPGENEKDERGTIIGIVKLKYLKIMLIALVYPLTMILLNLMNGLAVNFVTLSIFSGIIGFLFETMLRGVWVFSIVIVIWILYNLVRDSNVQKKIAQMGRFKING